MKGGDHMPKGDYKPDSNYFIGVLPNGVVKWYCEERDWKEEYADMEAELEAKK